jgi:hypothetical protein
MRSSHERLSQFFSGYFHEDWELEADDPSGIIDLYLSQQAAREQQIGVAADLDTLLSSDLSDEAVSKMLFQDLGCYYDPAADGLSARTWLQDVSRRLKVQP